MNTEEINQKAHEYFVKDCYEYDSEEYIYNNFEKAIIDAYKAGYKADEVYMDNLTSKVIELEEANEHQTLLIQQKENIEKQLLTENKKLKEEIVELKKVIEQEANRYVEVECNCSNEEKQKCIMFPDHCDGCRTQVIDILDLVNKGLDNKILEEKDKEIEHWKNVADNLFELVEQAEIDVDENGELVY